jgi:hypothetical protein
MPVLYGVFLYMGVASLNGLQFFDRILLILMPKKYQPDYPYLRHVGTCFVLGCMQIISNVFRFKLEEFIYTPLYKLHALCSSGTRGWVVPLLGGNPIWTPFLAFLPAVLGSILIFMDQQITAVIINRKEHKLTKGCGYHLDLLIVAVCIVICSVLGLPWFVAATVLSINHVRSLYRESESGEGVFYFLKGKYLMCLLILDVP